MRKPKVVFIGPCADPTDVGEALSTWRWVSGLSEHVDATLLTYVKAGRSSAKDSLPGVRVIEWSDLPMPASCERLNAALRPGYPVFYLRARRWIKRAIAAGERFDLAHQVAPLALRYPSPAVGLGIPLIVGPLAGSIETPDQFRRETAADPWFVQLRRFDRLRFRFDPFLRRTYERAALVIGVAPYVRDVLEGVRLRDFALECETGVYELPQRVERDMRTRPLRFLYVGRVVRTKGVRDAVRAMARCRDVDVSLDVVGAGNDLEACRAEATSLGVDDRVRFHGRMARADVDPFYRSAQAFLFPSFREPSGNVVLEAMSWGLPTISADRGGPAFALPADAGLRVPVQSPEQYASGLADAIHEFVAAPARMQAMGESARQAAETHHMWPAKIQRMLGLFDRVLGTSAVANERLVGAA